MGNGKWKMEMGNEKWEMEQKGIVEWMQTNVHLSYVRRKRLNKQPSPLVLKTHSA